MTPLIAASEIRAGVTEMGRRITADYRDRSLTILGVLTGGIVLLADLIRVIDLPLRVGFLRAFELSRQGKRLPNRSQSTSNSCPMLQDATSC